MHRGSRDGDRWHLVHGRGWSVPGEVKAFQPQDFNDVRE
jgi:hypothetical protein